MKSNYIIAHCVYIVIKSVHAITLLAIHHSIKITIAVNFTFIFSWFTLKSRILLACFGRWMKWQDLIRVTASHRSYWTWEHVRWGMSTTMPSLLLSGTTCPFWGLAMLSWEGFETSWVQLLLKVPFISTYRRSLRTCALKCLKPDHLKCLHPSGIVVCRRKRIDGP